MAIVLIFEEWLWDELSAFGHKLVEWLHLARIELWLMQASPLQALTAFSLPILIVTPINLAALFMLSKGLIIKGILLEIVAKLLGTVLIARVFALTKPQLMTYDLLRFVYDNVNRWLLWAHRRIIQAPLYRWAKDMSFLVKVQISDWLRLNAFGKSVRDVFKRIGADSRHKPGS